jgi:hypothetical protein
LDGRKWRDKVKGARETVIAAVAGGNFVQEAIGTMGKL